MGMVIASQQAFLENEAGHNAEQSKLPDSRLQAQTQAMIAVPFHLFRPSDGHCRDHSPISAGVLRHVNGPDILPP
jgi:hypothetical protein